MRWAGLRINYFPLKGLRCSLMPQPRGISGEATFELSETPQDLVRPVFKMCWKPLPSKHFLKQFKEKSSSGLVWTTLEQNLKWKPIECAYNLLLFPGSQCLIKAHQHGLHWPEKKSRFRIPWLCGQISWVSSVLGDHQGSPSLSLWKGTCIVPNLQGTTQSSKQALPSVSGETDWCQKSGCREHFGAAA